LTRGYLVDNIPTLQAAWYVSFEVNPKATVARQSNIIHFTINKDVGSYGDRVPGVWFISHTTKLHICSAVSGNVNYCFQTNPLRLNAFTKVEIANTFVSNGQSWYEIRVGGQQVHRVRNTRPAYFANVKVYRGDPWYNPSKAEIKNLVFNNLPHGKKSNNCYFTGFLEKNSY